MKVKALRDPGRYLSLVYLVGRDRELHDGRHKEDETKKKIETE